MKTKIATTTCQSLLVKNFVRPSGLALSLIPLFTPLQAAVVNVTSAGIPVTSVDLTTAGTFDWAAWDVRTAAEVTQAAYTPTSQKNGGTTVINAVTTGEANLRGTNATASYQDVTTFTWSDGSGSPVHSDGHLHGVFHSLLNQEDWGVRLQLSGLDALTEGQFYRIGIYAGAYEGRTRVTADDGISELQVQLGSLQTDRKNTDLFQFDYTPGSADDLLTFEFILEDIGNGDSPHALLQAVTISIVPEPSSALLSLLAGGIALGFRRRSLKNLANS